MTNAELIKRLRAVAKQKSAAALGTDFGHDSLETLAADALEAAEARMTDLELVNAQLILELGNIETNTEQTQEAIRRIAHYRRER